jgi:TonB family protein
MADPWVRPTSPGPPDPGIPFRPDNDVRPASGKTQSPDDYLLIDRLREDAASGRMDLDSILSEATHAARYFTDGTGAALALWSQGVVICRARSGDTAPPLGAKLDVDSGISGECLRSGRSKRCNDTLTDPLVDGAVCQEMGIRSLAAVPLRGEHGVVGILEVFADRPYAFSDAHITLLKQLAQIAVTGRAKAVPAAAPPMRQSAPGNAVAVATVAKAKPVLLQTIAARIKGLKELKGEEGQPARMVVAGTLLVLLVGGFTWLLSRGHIGSNHAPRSVHAASATAAPVETVVAPDMTLTVTPTATEGKARREILHVGIAKPSATKDADAKDLVRQASKETVTDRATPSKDDETPSHVSAPGPTPKTAAEDVQAPDPSVVMSGTQLASAREIPQIGLAQPAVPTVALRMSQGITGGRLTHQVRPTYPSLARMQRIEGAVVLEALVGEDGNVHDVKITSGPPVLATAAKQAVEQWRYEPFQLNGKPVALNTEVKIVFKLPE